MWYLKSGGGLATQNGTEIILSYKHNIWIDRDSFLPFCQKETTSFEIDYPSIHKSTQKWALMFKGTLPQRKQILALNEKADNYFHARLVSLKVYPFQ